MSRRLMRSPSDMKPIYSKLTCSEWIPERTYSKAGPCSRRDVRRFKAKTGKRIALCGIHKRIYQDAGRLTEAK